MSSSWQHELFISGYVRRQYSHNVAIEIKELIRLFWSEYILWTINQKELKKLKNMKPTAAPSHLGHESFFNGKDNHIAHDKRTMYSSTLLPIVFNCSKDNDFVIGFALWAEFKHGLQRAQYYYELHCKEANMSIKALDARSGGGTYLYSSHLSDILELRIPDDLKELNLMYLFEMQSIRYSNSAFKQTKGLQNYSRMPQILRYFEYEWKLNEKEVEMLKSANEQNCVNLNSELFNDRCFKLCISPKSENGFHTVVISLVFLKILPLSRQFEVKMHIKIEPALICIETSKKLGADDQCDISEQISINQMIEKANKPFTIHGKFEILGIWEVNRAYRTERKHRYLRQRNIPYYLEITGDKWEDIGIINNKKGS